MGDGRCLFRCAAIRFILFKALTIKEYCRQKDVSEQTFYKWRKRFGTMEVEEVRHFKQLQQENARLKRLLAERDPEIDVMKEVLAKKW